MEQAADRTEAAAVDQYFSSSTENIFVSVCLTDSGKQTDGCFVMRLRSSSRGRNTNIAVIVPVLRRMAVRGYTV